MTRLKDIAGSSLGRILVGFTAVAAVFAGAWLWSLSGPLTNAVVRQQQENLTSVAQAASLVVSQSEESPDRVVRQLVARTDIRMTIVAGDGTVLADSDTDPAEMENHADRPEIAAALKGNVGNDRRRSATEGTEQVYVAVPGTLGSERVAVRAAQPLDEIKAIAATWRRAGMLLLSVAAAVALAIVVKTARSTARPVSLLSTAAGRMAAGDLGVRVPEVPTDMRELAGALETLRQQMRARIEALDAERVTLRSALDGLSDAVLVIDGGRVALANTATEGLLGRPPHGWDGAALDEAGLPASVESVLLDMLARTTPTVLELEPDPTGRALRLYAAPLDADGQHQRSIVVVADVTERARLDRVRRDFVSNASHELKTPVAGIGLLAQSAEMAAADGDHAQAVAFARQIAAEIARLQRLVCDLLDLSRLESTPAPDAIADVRQAVGLAVISHKPAATRKGLSIVQDFSSVANRDVFVAADPTDLAIALDNLLDNAISYTNEGGVRVAVTTSDDAAVISVEDTGMGVAAEHLPRVFERFYRVDGGRSRDAGGTGLGLSLVKHVVERNGGTADVESAPGRGSVFTLRLPLRS